MCSCLVKKEIAFSASEAFSFNSFVIEISLISFPKGFGIKTLNIFDAPLIAVELNVYFNISGISSFDFGFTFNRF